MSQDAERDERKAGEVCPTCRREPLSSELESLLSDPEARRILAIDLRLAASPVVRDLIRLDRAGLVAYHEVPGDADAVLSSTAEVPISDDAMAAQARYLRGVR